MDVIVTPAPWVIVVAPAPVWAKFSTVPTGYAADELGGIVAVLAEALAMVTRVLLPSAKTKVYEAVWAFTATAGVMLVLVNRATAIIVLFPSQ